MFIDYLTLMLINAAAGFFVLAWFLLRGIEGQQQQSWAPAFAVPGLVLFVTGLHMITTWPLPGSFNSAFGELSTLFGALLLGAALALWKGWNLIPVAIYALFAGIVGIVLGIRFIDLGLSGTPVLTGIGFILSGLGGVLALPALYLRGLRPVRMLGAAVLGVAALIWTFIGLGGYWMHMESFAKWVPSLMR